MSKASTKALTLLSKVGKSSAVKSAGAISRVWFHQPKVPARLSRPSK